MRATPALPCHLPLLTLTCHSARLRFRCPLDDLSVVDVICLRLGTSALGVAVGGATAHAAAVRAGRLQLEPALKRFLCRQLKEGSELQPGWPLHFCAGAKSFPWPKGAEVSEEEAEGAIPAEVSVKHAYCLWQELKESVEPSAPPRQDSGPKGGSGHAAGKRPAAGKKKSRWGF